jgi:GNAT superfamily N-acetyltransferase
MFLEQQGSASGYGRRQDSRVSDPSPLNPSAGSRVLLRPGTRADLAAVNRVIEAAVMGWDLPERVKRLSLPTYRYGAQDLDHLDLTVAVDGGGAVAAVAAAEPADAADAPVGCRALLVHGLYVRPDRQGTGVGRLLVRFLEGNAEETGWHGLLVKAHASAAGFFEAMGFEPLPVRDPGRDYPYRYWKRSGSGTAEG